MIGPAFINAAESASSIGSMHGYALPITRNACALRCAGNAPVGSRFARIVIATSDGPCLRAR